MNIGLQVAFNILFLYLVLAALDLLCRMQGLLCSCRAGASHRGSFSRGARTLGHAGFSSGAWAQ